MAEADPQPESPPRSAPNPPEPPPADRDGHVARISSNWVFILSALIIIVAMGATVFYVFGPAGDGDAVGDRVRYRLIVLMLIFALTMVLSMVFAVRAKLEGSLGNMMFVVGGPAAFWLIAVSLVFTLLPDKDLHDPMTIKKLNIELDAAQKLSGWLSTEDWKRAVNDFWRLVERDNNAMLVDIDDVLVRKRQSAKLLPDSPKISTVIIYNAKQLGDGKRKGTLKVQRIVGRVKGDAALVPFVSRGTKQDSTTQSLLFVGWGEPDVPRGIKKIFTSSGERSNNFAVSDHHEGIQNFYDCFVITRYSDAPEQDDFFITDIPSYSGNRRARLLTGFIGLNGYRFDRELAGRTSAWSVVRPLQFWGTQDSGERMMFRRLHAKPEFVGKHTDIGMTPMGALSKDIDAWIKVIWKSAKRARPHDESYSKDCKKRMDGGTSDIDSKPDGVKAPNRISSASKLSECWWRDMTELFPPDQTSPTTDQQQNTAPTMDWLLTRTGTDRSLVYDVKDASNVTLIMLEMPEPNQTNNNSAPNSGSN